MSNNTNQYIGYWNGGEREVERGGEIQREQNEREREKHLSNYEWRQ